MFLLAPYIGFMPQATLAAVVMVYSVGLIEPGAFRDIIRVRRMEFVWAIAAFLGVMLLGTLKGIVVAIVWSLWLGIIIALIGLIAFGGFARGRWY